MQYTSETFQSIKDGAEIDGHLIEDCGSAAKVFAQRLANRKGNQHRAIVDQVRCRKSSATYWVTIVAPDGVVEDKEYMVVTVED